MYDNRKIPAARHLLPSASCSPAAVMVFIPGVGDDLLSVACSPRPHAELTPKNGRTLTAHGA